MSSGRRRSPKYTTTGETRRFRAFGDKREICRVQDPEAVVQVQQRDGLRDLHRPDASDLIADLHSHPFDYADTRLCGDDARQPEAGGFVEHAELHFRSLAPAGADEHVDIVGCGAAAGVRLVDARRVDTLDDQQPGRRPHRAATALQDLCGPHVIPVVDDVF